MIENISGATLEDITETITSIPEGIPIADVVVCGGYSSAEHSSLLERCTENQVGVVFLGGRLRIPGTVPGPFAVVRDECSGEELEIAIDAVGAGLIAGDVSLLSQVYRSDPDEDEAISPDAPKITIREQEVLRFVAAGYSNSDIAGYMHISENTVKYHLSKINEKLGAANRAEAVLRGIQSGVLEA